MKKNYQYFPMMLFQVILMVLYFVFVRYEVAEDVVDVKGPINPKPERKTQRNSAGVLEDYDIRGFSDTHVMIFIGFGFLMTFLKKYCYSALGFNFLLAALSIQWALLCQNFYHMVDGKIIVTKKLLLEADVMAATVLITFGALLGITSSLQLIFLAIVEVAVGCFNFWLVADYFQAADVGGSISIHAYGAYFGLGASLVLSKKKAVPQVQQPDHPGSGVWSTSSQNLNAPSYNSDITAMIGSLFLWIYWPSFNSALTSGHLEYQRAVVNTYLSLASATVTTFFLSAALTHEHKLDMVHVQNSTLAGGVAVGSVCNMFVSAGGAIAIGIGAGVLSVFGFMYLTPRLNNLGMLDTCGVNNLHGMPGVYSGILSIAFAYFATENTYGKMELENIFPAMATGRTAGNQALNQLYALLVTLGISFVAGLAAGLGAKYCKPLKINEEYSDEPSWELPA